MLSTALQLGQLYSFPAWEAISRDNKRFTRLISGFCLGGEGQPESEIARAYRATLTILKVVGFR